MIATQLENEKQRRPWLENLPSGQFRHLFDHLAGTLFFAKNRDFRLMMGNPAFVARCGRKCEADIVGLGDFELFPPKLAAKYRADDERIICTGKPVMGMIELFPDMNGNSDLSVTDKLPLFGVDGEVCGVCGIVRSYEGARVALEPYLELQPVVDYLKKNFREKLSVEILAGIVGLSVRQLERKFRETFQASPRAYLLRLRILTACELLKRTNKRVTEVALEVGFYDHSDFSRHFKKTVGQTPSHYRKQEKG